jgi:hypothetical protein
LIPKEKYDEDIKTYESKIADLENNNKETDYLSKNIETNNDLKNLRIESSKISEE